MTALGDPMQGESCTALPYEDRFREQLRAACAEDLEIWDIYSLSCRPEHFGETIDGLIAWPLGRTFVLFDGDEFAGMSSFLHIDDPQGTLEIGFTYYRPKMRGTGFNRRVKEMMLKRAFDCGYRRVEFKVDRRNLRSQAAVKKIGAVREGILRQHKVTWTGHVRDTVIFSILRDEWPA